MEYKIAGVTLKTARPLPDDVQIYMAQWADDPIWDIWNSPRFADYEPELRAFEAIYSLHAQRDWEARKGRAGDLDAARSAFLMGGYDQAIARAAIAQAEAARPRFIRIGDHTINLAHIAYVDYDGKDIDGNKLVEITFLACSSEYCMGLRFRKHEVEPVAALLREVLEPYTVAALDFPMPEAEPQPQSPFTVIN